MQPDVDLPRTFESQFVERDNDLALDPAALFWSGATSVAFNHDEMGRATDGHGTRVWSRWTQTSLYVLFACEYRDLYLKPDPQLDAETYALWEWDVAEIFLGADLNNIRKYKEFEVSPQAEWIDLDVDLDSPRHEDGWLWQSGMEVAARVDEAAHVWYGAMRIPFASLMSTTPHAGIEFRANLLRAQGPPERRVLLAWQPPMRATFHTPEVFGVLRLV